MVICLDQGADLHMVQLMPLPLRVRCFRKIQIDIILLVTAHPVVPDKGPLIVCCCTHNLFVCYICWFVLFTVCLYDACYLA